MKYQAAKCGCRANDVSWTDPRTGVTYPAPSDNKNTINEQTCSMCGDSPSSQCGDSGCPYNVRT